MAKDPACGAALVNLMTALIAGDMPQKTSDMLSPTTLIVFLKKNAEAMEALKSQLGHEYVQPQRPIGMGTTIAKVGCNYALLLVKDAMGPVVEPS